MSVRVPSVENVQQRMAVGCSMHTYVQYMLNQLVLQCQFSGLAKMIGIVYFGCSQ